MKEQMPEQFKVQMVDRLQLILVTLQQDIQKVQKQHQQQVQTLQGVVNEQKREIILLKSQLDRAQGSKDKVRRKEEKGICYKKMSCCVSGKVSQFDIEPLVQSHTKERKMSKNTTLHKSSTHKLLPQHQLNKSSSKQESKKKPPLHHNHRSHKDISNQENKPQITLDLSMEFRSPPNSKFSSQLILLTKDRQHYTNTEVRSPLHDSKDRKNSTATSRSKQSTLASKKQTQSKQNLLWR